MNTTNQQTIQTIPQEVQDAIMGKMVFFKDGIEQIALGNYALDFKQSYVFLGFTKNKTQVILGDIHTFGTMQQDGKREIKYKKRFAKVELKHSSKVEVTGEPGNFTSKTVPYNYWQIHTDGFRYSETIMEVGSIPTVKELQEKLNKASEKSIQSHIERLSKN